MRPSGVPHTAAAVARGVPRAPARAAAAAASAHVVLPLPPIIKTAGRRFLSEVYRVTKGV